MRSLVVMVVECFGVAVMVRLCLCVCVRVYVLVEFDARWLCNDCRVVWCGVRVSVSVSNDYAVGSNRRRVVGFCVRWLYGTGR